MQQLNFMTSLSTTGYGIAGFNIVLKLSKLSKLNIFSHGEYNIDSTDEQREIIQECCNLDFNPNAPCVNMWHQFDLLQRVGNGTYYGWPIFELTRFTDVEMAHMRVPHHLIVCSHWAEEIVKKQLPSANVHIVPLGVDTELFHPTDTVERPYTFINLGKWEKRKGHDILGQCFDKAFERSDDVELKLAPYNAFLNQQQKFRWEESYKTLKLSNKVTILPPATSHADIACYMQHADCGVFPSRAEGWNLELLEMMACDKPVITTNYSAHTEFCNRGNSFLVDIKELEPAHDGIWFNGQGDWASFDYDQEEQLIEHMRFCYQNHVVTNPAGLETAQRFTWANTATTLYGIIHDHC